MSQFRSSLAAAAVLVSSLASAQEFIPLELPDENSPQHAEALKKEQKRAVAARLRRLNAFSRVMQTWITETCNLSERQQVDLKTLCERTIIKSQSEWLERKSTQSQKGPLCDTGPISFVVPSGAAIEIDLVHNKALFEELAKLLTPDQLTALNTAKSQRSEFLVECLVGQIINRLDEEYYFTSKQRRDLRSILRPAVVSHKDDSPTQSAQCMTVGLHIAWVLKLIKTADDLGVLNESQAEWAQDIRSRGSSFRYQGTSRMLSLSTAENGKSWVDIHSELNDLQKDCVLRAVERRIASAEEDAEPLTRKDRRHLRVAAKGVAERVVTAWAQQERERIIATEQANGGQPFDELLLSGGIDHLFLWTPHVSILDCSPLWHHTLRKLSATAQNALAIRTKARNLGDASTIVGLLDRELWLTEGQRTALTNFVLEHMPEFGVHVSSTKKIPDHSLFVFAIHCLPQPDESVLTQDQRDIWQMLSAHYASYDDGKFILYSGSGRGLVVEVPR